jgi:VWFA-related protein
MRQPAITTLIIVLTLGPILKADAQQPTSGANAQADRQTVVVNTSEVRLDAVVKDKKGRPVKDLTATDFEILEDGVRQEIQSFRQVGSPEHEVAAPDTTAKAGVKPIVKEGSPVTLGPNYVALVFDRLTPGARVLAHDAAVKLVSEGMKPNDFVGVFGTALNFHIFQQYTNNSQSIRAGIDRAGLQAGGEFGTAREKLSQDRDTLRAVMTGLPATGVAPTGDVGVAGLTAAQLKAEIRMLETYEDFESDRQGYATTDGLLALVDSLRNVAGRKSVIFFSEGITIPANVQAHFQSVIGSANRAGVTVYTVDAAGLRIDSATAETRKEIDSRSAARLSEIGTTAEGSNGPMTQGLERNERILTLNPESGLSRLADQTGGMFIHNSNDLKTRMGQIGDDMNSYYVLTYVPKNLTFDGKFRKTEVKLKRQGLSIQSRKGYFAINAAYTSPVLDFEAPALAAAGSENQPHDLPVRSIALSFPEPERPDLVIVLADLPLSTISFKSDQQKKQYSTDFTLVTLIKNPQGQIVRKLSKQYVLTGDLDKLAATQKEQVLYYRETDLEPGHYTVQTIAYDGLTNKAGVKEGALDFAGSGEGSDDSLRISSLVLLGRAEKLSASDKGSANPLQVGGLQVYPLLAEIHKTKKQLTFFISIYQGKAAAQNVPKITIELSQNGRSLGAFPGETPPADATGRRQFIGALPLETLPPGSYQMKITVSDGKSTASTAGTFSLAL